MPFGRVSPDCISWGDARHSRIPNYCSFTSDHMTAMTPTWKTTHSISMLTKRSRTNWINEMVVGEWKNKVDCTKKRASPETRGIGQDLSSLRIQCTKWSRSIYNTPSTKDLQPQDTTIESYSIDWCSGCKGINEQQWPASRCYTRKHLSSNTTHHTPHTRHDSWDELG